MNLLGFTRDVITMTKDESQIISDYFFLMTFCLNYLLSLMDS